MLRMNSIVGRHYYADNIKLRRDRYPALLSKVNPFLVFIFSPLQLLKFVMLINNLSYFLTLRECQAIAKILGYHIEFVKN